MHQRTWQVTNPSDEQLTSWRSSIGRPLDIRWNGHVLACVLAELHGDEGTAQLVVELENDEGLPASDVPLTVAGDLSTSTSSSTDRQRMLTMPGSTVARRWAGAATSLHTLSP